MLLAPGSTADTELMIGRVKPRTPQYVRDRSELMSRITKIFESPREMYT